MTLQWPEAADANAQRVWQRVLVPIAAEMRASAGELARQSVARMRAEVPQHELSRYPIDLRSVSHGTGSFTRSFVRYDYMPAAQAREIIGS